MIIMKFNNSEEASAYYKARYEKNKPIILLRTKKYRDNNKEKVALCNKKWRASHKEKVALCNKKWREKNRDYLLNKKTEDYYKNKEYCLTRQKEYNESHKSECNARSRAYKLRNREKLNIYQKEYYFVNKEYLAKNMKIYRANNREKINLSIKKLKLKNPAFKLRCLLSSYLCKLIDKKQQKSQKLLGYNFNQLKEHLEKQFTSKMSWANHGKVWHIDHINPVAWYKTDSQIIKKAFALQNLQPLPIKLNLSKKDNYSYNIEKNSLSNKLIYLEVLSGVSLNG